MPSLLVSRAIPYRSATDAVGINTVPGSRCYVGLPPTCGTIRLARGITKPLLARLARYHGHHHHTSGQHSRRWAPYPYVRHGVQGPQSGRAAQWAYEEIQLGAPSWTRPPSTARPPTVLPFPRPWTTWASVWVLMFRGDGMVNGRVDLLIPPKPWPVLPMPVYHHTSAFITSTISGVLCRVGLAYSASAPSQKPKELTCFSKPTVSSMTVGWLSRYSVSACHGHLHPQHEDGLHGRGGRR